MKKNFHHPFQPVYNENSKILILGSFPSVKSREDNFYYGHPQNRFWRVISSILKEELPISAEDKIDMMLRNRIALWDCIASCDIHGSSDASISNVIPNRLTEIISTADIQAIFCNGKKAYELYTKYIEAQINISAVCLPSTSPANAAWNLEKLINEYSHNISPYIEIKGNTSA